MDVVDVGGGCSELLPVPAGNDFLALGGVFCLEEGEVMNIKVETHITRSGVVKLVVVLETPKSYRTSPEFRKPEEAQKWLLQNVGRVR